MYVSVVGWGNTQQSEPGFGASNDTASVKAKIVNLIASVRTLMRSMLLSFNLARVWRGRIYCGTVMGSGALCAGYED